LNEISLRIRIFPLNSVCISISIGDAKDGLKTRPIFQTESNVTFLILSAAQSEIIGDVDNCTIRKFAQFLVFLGPQQG
jgi:hypothetical protein